MKENFRILSYTIFCFAFASSVYSADLCVNCGTDVRGMPVDGMKLAGLEKVAYSIPVPPSQKEYIDKYCMKFNQIEPQAVVMMIKDMETTPYPVDDYFKTPACQSEGYSDGVKSPMIHIVADDPNGRENFLKNIWLYYSKKRKQPEIFTAALNSKNTRGETLLDYIESLKVRNIINHPEQQEPLKNIIKFACDHGGVYSAYSKRECPSI